MALTRMIRDLKRGLLVSPRHEQYLASCQGEVRLSPETVEFVAAQLLNGDRNRSATFSASGRGNCPRQQIFGFLGLEAERVVGSDTAAIFVNGTWTHLKWQAMGLEAGWLKHVEVPCRIDNFSLTGTIDGILDTGEGWELKSINSRGFREVCEKGPLEKHLYQIHAYMMATNIRSWSLVYEEKDTQQWREWVVPFSQEIADFILDELMALNVSRETKTLPLIREDCAKGEGTTYKQCPYKNQCLEITSWPTKTGIKLPGHSASISLMK